MYGTDVGKQLELVGFCSDIAQRRFLQMGAASTTSFFSQIGLEIIRCVVRCDPCIIDFVLPSTVAHKECIDPWLETKAVCAYCKVKVEPQKSCCDHFMGSTCNRLGIRFAAPNTIRFSSSRRTYTNQDVRKNRGGGILERFHPKGGGGSLTGYFRVYLLLERPLERIS